MTSVVTIKSNSYKIMTHGGEAKVTEYTIMLNDVRLHRYSTNDNSEAEERAKKYARRVARTLGVGVVTEKGK